MITKRKKFVAGLNLTRGFPQKLIGLMYGDKLLEINGKR